VAAVWVIGIYGAYFYVNLIRVESRTRALLAWVLGSLGWAW
jgi:hypothetical protein